MDTFDRNFSFNVEHVSIAKKADLVLIAPGSANVIGKLAAGICDDMLTTTVFACKCKKLISPAMNTNMYENPILQDNLKKLEGYGYEVIDPATGYLACGDTGSGKMPEPEVLLQYILRELAEEHTLSGKKVLVSAGPTREAIDPVRFISNHSTGKMGYAIARAAMERGAEVTLVTGPVELTPPMFVKVRPVITAEEMSAAMKDESIGQDIVIMTAAVADYRPAEVAREKIKKTDNDASIQLERTEDILSYLGQHKDKKQILIGFSMETENMLLNSRAKLQKKKADMIVANNLKTEGAGFGTDTNVVTLITEDSEEEYPCMSKDDVARVILDKAESMLSL